MLFRTVYGPELQAVYGFIGKQGAVRWSLLRQWMVQQEITNHEGTNLEEAVAFLLELGLLERDHEYPDVLRAVPTSDFRLAILERLPRENMPDRPVQHPLDIWFRKILSVCFVLPNRSYVPKLHRAVNELELPTPCSEEKVNAWRRVMEFLGCGRRVGDGGFLACYSAALVESILSTWKPEGSLDECLRFIDRFVPALTRTGDMAGCVALPLRYLESRGRLRLMPRADFAGRAYFGDRRVKWILIGG